MDGEPRTATSTFTQLVRRKESCSLISVGRSYAEGFTVPNTLAGTVNRQTDVRGLFGGTEPAIPKLFEI